jgi:phage terminase small subunit
LATAERCQRLQLTADDVLEELAHIGRSDLGHVLDFTGDDLRLRPVREIPVAVRRTISSVKVRRRVQGCGEDARAVEVTEFKLWDKIAALDKIGKHLGLFIDRHEHTGPDGQPLQIEFIDLISAPAAPATGPGDGR